MNTMSRRLKRFSGMLAAAIVAVLVLAACGTASTSAASCGFIVGTGEGGSDRSLRSIVYPGQQVDVGSGERIEYFPCNDRNWKVTDGSVQSVTGEKVGDRTTPIRAYTETGTPIDITVSAYWTLNQNPEALTEFYPNCHKFNCASKEESAGDVNNSSAGWIDMLNENFDPALELTTMYGAKTLTDDVWLSQDMDQYQVLADYISANLGQQLRTPFGSSMDLFCGSTSQWPDPTKPGEGEFTCNPIGIQVTAVTKAKVADDGTQATAAINQQRLENAEALYGDNAGFWLGIQDTVQQCKDAGVTCVFNIGNPSTQGSPNVSVPITTPTPTPEPSEGESGG